MINKKYFLKWISILVLLLPHISSKAQKQPIDYVNVFTGTSNSRWQLFPGPTLPFGMVKLSPDNQENVWNGGYEYTIGSISGFSHLHAMALSALSVMPTTGKSYANEGWLKSFASPADGPFGNMWTAGYRSRFKKETEVANPGYYSVDLLDYNVKAELSSTMRCGMMRFTYPETKEAHLILNLDFATEEKNEVSETYIEKVSDTEIRGYIKQKNTYVPEYTTYFVLQLNKAIASADAWQTEPYTGTNDSYGTVWRQKRAIQKNITRFKGSKESGAVLNFSTSAGEAIIVRTGLSFVNMQQAKLNLETEMKDYGYDFDKVVAASKRIWSELLGKVEVFGKNEDDKIKFYTNLYRTYTGKSVMNDVNGKYVDACRKVQQLADTGKAVTAVTAFGVHNGI